MNVFYKKIVLLGFLTITSISISYCQRGFFVTGGIQLGAGAGKNAYKFEQTGNKLEENWWGIGGDHDADDPVRKNSNTRTYAGLNLNYFFLNHFGLNVGIDLMDECLIVHDKDFMNRNNFKDGNFYESRFSGMRMNNGNFNVREWYINPNIGGIILFNNSQTAAGPYLGFGIGFNNYISKSREIDGTFSHSASNENLILKTHFQQQFNSQYIEFGFLMIPDNYTNYSKPKLKMATRESLASIAIRYTFIGNFAQADYSNFKNGKVQYTDHVTLNGSYLSIVLKAGGGVFANAVDHVYKHSYENKIARIEARKSDSINKSKVLYIPKKTKGRSVNYSKNLIVKNDSITVYFWDHGRYDMDIVSIDFNGNWVSNDDTLTIEKKQLRLKLREGINYLICHAISEGKEKPCTISILVDDGITKQKLTLNSTLNESDAIKIKYIP